MRLSTFVVSGFMAVLSHPVGAATIDSVQGQVSVNRGQGFQAVGVSTQVKAGDMVMAAANSSAKVSYPDKCMVEVRPGAVVTIGQQSPCKAAYSLGKSCDPNDDKSFCPPAPYAHSLLPFAVGTGVALGAFLISRDNDDGGGPRPRSP